MHKPIYGREGAVSISLDPPKHFDSTVKCPLSCETIDPDLLALQEIPEKPENSYTSTRTVRPRLPSVLVNTPHQPGYVFKLVEEDHFDNDQKQVTSFQLIFKDGKPTPCCTVLGYPSKPQPLDAPMPFDLPTVAPSTYQFSIGHDIIVESVTLPKQYFEHFQDNSDWAKTLAFLLDHEFEDGCDLADMFVLMTPLYSSNKLAAYPFLYVNRQDC